MQLREIRVEKVLNRHKRRDSWFLDDHSVNPYTGCSYGCVYCYIRSGRYGRRDLAVKVNAPRVLDKELSRLRRRRLYGYIALGTVTEPWMHFEERYRVTREVLKVVLRHRFPVHCLTKSLLILRDIDLISQIDERAVLPHDLADIPGRGAMITFSFSTMQDELAKVVEPNAPPPSERLSAAERAIEAGLMVGMAFIPVLPYISDSEMDEMARVARDVEASYVFFSPPTLHGVGKNHFLRFVEHRFPQLLGTYRSLYVGSYPPRWRLRDFYLRAVMLCKKYRLRFGPRDLNPIFHGTEWR